MHSVTSGAVANALGYLVWENSDSTVDIGATTINFDRVVPDSYSKILIEYRNLTSENYFFFQECEVGKGTYLNAAYTASSGNTLICSRLCDTSRQSITIGICRYTNSSSGFREVENRCVPHKIWAIK